MKTPKDLKVKKDLRADLITCPSCGKKITKADTCPKCGASTGMRDRISIKKVHLYVLLLGVIGLGLLGYTYYESTIITPINKVTPSREGDTLRISGRVVDMSYDNRYQRTTFYVNDSTGSLRVFGWSGFTSDLFETGTYPGIGDNMTVEGIVNVYKEDVSLEVSSSNSFTIIKNEPKKMDIGEIDSGTITQKVTVEGEVTESKVSKYGTAISYVMLTVEDETGTITVFITDDQLALESQDVVFPNATDSVQITGMVKMFNEEMEIIPTYANNQSIKILEEE